MEEKDLTKEQETTQETVAQDVAEAMVNETAEKNENLVETDFAEYNKETNEITLRPGVTVQDIANILPESTQGCSVVFAKSGGAKGDNQEVETFEVSPDLLKAIGSNALHMTIEKGLAFEYVSPEDGDIWSNFSELRTLTIKNNKGLPTNVDGTGAFQSHPTLRCVDMRLSDEGELSDNFLRNTAVSSVMIHSAENGREYGLKAGDNVLFGSALESEKGLSTADWNKIHGNQICKTHKDDAYLTELGRFEDAIEDTKTALSRDGAIATMQKSSDIKNIIKEVAVREKVYTNEDFDTMWEKGIEKGFSKEDIKKLDNLVPKAKEVLNELKKDFRNDLVGTCIEKGQFCSELVNDTLKDCSTEAQNDFKDAFLIANFKYNVRLSEIIRDQGFYSNLQERLDKHVNALQDVMGKTYTPETEKDKKDNLKPEDSQKGKPAPPNGKIIRDILASKGQDNALDIVLNGGKSSNINEKAYARALVEVSDAINESQLNKEDKTEAKTQIKSIADMYGLSYSARKRIEALETLAHTHKQKDGTYIELPSRLWTGDNFLSCRKTEIHSATDPAKRLLDNEVNSFVAKTAHAIYAACVEYRESFALAGLKSIIDAQENKGANGEKEKNVYYFKDNFKNPIEAYNKFMAECNKPEFMASREDLIARGIEERLKALNQADRKQVKDVFDFVMDTAKAPPKDAIKEAEFLDQRIADIVQAGDKGFEELRKVLPSLDLTPDGHVLDLETRNLLKNTENVLVVAEGGKLGDHCVCFTNCRGVYVGHSENEYRHFREWAEKSYLNSKAEVHTLMQARMGIVPGSDADKDFLECGGLSDDIKETIKNLQTEMNRAPSYEDKKNGITSKSGRYKEDYAKALEEWNDFQKKYETYTVHRAVWEANNTEEKWLASKSYALQEINKRIAHFEEIHATRKTKDFKTHQDVYVMERDALSDENKAEYDKLLAEKAEILTNPKIVVTGQHFCSEGKDMGNDRTVIAGGPINAGVDSFRNNPEITELHKNNPETNITDDVMRKNLYDQSDIFRGRMLMAKEKLKDVFDSRHFRYMRLEEACLDILVNLFKILFNLTTWAASTLEKEIRNTKTRRGIYNRNINEAKEILLSSSGKDGEAFLERLTSKTSPTSEYNAVLRVVGRLTLDNIINSDASDAEKLQMIHKAAGSRLRKAISTKERVDVLNKRDQLSKAQLLELYRNLGKWSREKGMAKTSKRLGVAISYSNGRSF